MVFKQFFLLFCFVFPSSLTFEIVQRQGSPRNMQQQQQQQQPEESEIQKNKKKT
jgi:hypothetical protein